MRGYGPSSRSQFVLETRAPGHTVEGSGQGAVRPLAPSPPFRIGNTEAQRGAEAWPMSTPAPPLPSGD